MKNIFMACCSCVLLGLSSCGQRQSTYCIETNMGTIKVKLFESTPRHRDNFEKLVHEKYYDSLLFHRVVRDFMIATGDAKSKNAEPRQVLGLEDPPYSFPGEIHALHFRGAVAAMGKPVSIDPSRASSGVQFFIVQGRPQTDQTLDKYEKENGFQYTPAQRELYKKIGGAPQLDGLYTVFGEVTEGMEVVDKIGALPTDEFNRPLQDVRIKIK